MRGTHALTAVLVASLGFLSACDDAPPCACTEEFRSYHLSVVDADGSPADEVEVRVVRDRTGERLDYGSPTGAPGVYLIMDDSFAARLAAEESFEVNGVLGEASFTAQFRFGTDPCRCHVSRLAGPDTVSLSL